MSLGITARGDAGQLKFEKLTEAVRSIAHNLGFDFSMTDSEKRPELRLTDNGIVTVSYGEDDNSVTIDSQTSVMGPGFHVLTVEFIDALIDITGIELEVEDETEYYSNRDFAALQRDHFCLWVSQVVGLIREKKNENNIRYSQPVFTHRRKCSRNFNCSGLRDPSGSGI